MSVHLHFHFYSGELYERCLVVYHLHRPVCRGYRRIEIIYHSDLMLVPSTDCIHTENCYDLIDMAESGPLRDKRSVQRK
jgi:hypothetical protein